MQLQDYAVTLQDHAGVSTAVDQLLTRVRMTPASALRELGVTGLLISAQQTGALTESAAADVVHASQVGLCQADRSVEPESQSVKLLPACVCQQAVAGLDCQASDCCCSRNCLDLCGRAVISGLNILRSLMLTGLSFV